MRSGHSKRLALLPLSVLLACSSASGPTEVRPPREARRAVFGGALLLTETASRAPSRASLCNLPITPTPIEVPGALPESEMTWALDLGGGTDLETTTDERGRATLVLQSPGLQTLRFRTKDQQYAGRVRVSAQARRTTVRGYLLDDFLDLDADADSKEALLVIELVPDENQDGVADFGGWTRYIFAESSGLLYRHLSNGVTEKVVLDANFEEQAVEIFDDYDGNLVPDDGDVLAALRGGSGGLPCPGFSHDTLFSAGSKHESFRCDRCHSPDKNDAPLGCQDCHHPLGRAAERP